MRIDRRALLMAVTFMAVAGAGCGSTAPVSHVLNVTVTVPVDGATVQVPGVRLLGTVTSAGGVPIRVHVHGHRVGVRRTGTFTTEVQLHRGLNRIRIMASAVGYPRALSELTVRYRPPGEGSALSAQSLAARVNNLCQLESDQAVVVAVNASGTGAVPSNARMMAYFRRLDQLEHTVADRLRSFAAPPSQVAAYQAYVTAQAGLAASFDGILAAAADREPAGVPRLLRGLRRQAAELQSLSGKLGFNDCRNVRLPTS